jgi:hypothetical protein
MTDTSTVQRKLDLARVLRDTFGIIKRQAALLFGLTFVLYLLPTAATTIYAVNISGKASSGDPEAALALFASPVYWVLLLLSILLGSFVYGYQLWIAISDLEGRTPTLQEALQVGLKRCLPILGAIALFGLGVGFGILLLIVPGIILGLMWAVTLPAVVERGGVFASFGRSRTLTRGNRWRIFGLFLALVIVAGVVQAILTGIVGAGATANGGGAAGGATIFAMVVISLYSWLMAVVFTVLLGALYVQLRELKGGGGESVAQVFS